MNWHMEKFLDFLDKVAFFMTALWLIYVPFDIYYIGDKYPIFSLGLGENIATTIAQSILIWIFFIITPWGLIMLGSIFIWHSQMPTMEERAKRN